MQGSSLNGASPEPVDDAATSLIALRDITKVYRMGDQEVYALRGVSLDVGLGEFIAIMGASGGGKSTMMNILGCLDRPTTGSYFLLGSDVSKLSDDEQATVRNRTIGFVFQSFNLLARTSALKNVELPLVYAGVPARERAERARAALETVGLGTRLDHHPNQLSGGQQQRVAIARALVTNTPIIMADEPTGNLDTQVSAEVMTLFQSLNADRGITIILVTHEEDIAAYARRVVRMRDGRIVSDQRGAYQPQHPAHAGMAGQQQTAAAPAANGAAPHDTQVSGAGGVVTAPPPAAAGGSSDGHD